MNKKKRRSKEKRRSLSLALLISYQDESNFFGHWYINSHLISEGGIETRSEP